MNSNQAQRPAATHTRAEDSARARRVRAIVVVVSSVTAALVVTGCLLAFGKTLVDQYYLFRLSVAETKADRNAFIETLVRRHCSKVVPDLLLIVGQLESDSNLLRVQDDVADKIASLGAGAIPYLREVMDGSDADPLFGHRLRELKPGQFNVVLPTAAFALEHLAEHDETAEEALEVLLLGLFHMDEEYVPAMVSFITDVAEPQSSKLALSIPYRMIDALKSDNPRMRRSAAEVLFELADVITRPVVADVPGVAAGPVVADVVTALSDAARSADLDTAAAAVHALRPYWPEDRRVRPLFVELLRGVEARIASRRLSEISPEAWFRDRLRDMDIIEDPDPASTDDTGAGAPDSNGEGTRPDKSQAQK